MIKRAEENQEVTLEAEHKTREKDWRRKTLIFSSAAESQ
jgi:hypothetical protein